MWERLSALPKIKCVRPQGAFYCFPNVSAYFGKFCGNADIKDAVGFAAALLEQSHVATAARARPESSQRVLYEKAGAGTVEVRGAC